MRMEWLKEQLEQRGLTQAAAGDAIGLSESKMSKVMNGSRKLSADEADGLRRFLGYYLPDDPRDAPEVRIMNHLSKLQSDQKRAVEAFLSTMFQGR
ncbi:helix-turn-helix transcriptional regulator [Paracoccus sp. (in: a-proteobacteria)]|uniref:helix-turn-helix domain-containing protein n=1 Tax=Paracoccus sp. TaxID=267 RepID=UPI0032D8FD68